MLPKVSLTNTPEWNQLKDHYENEMKKTTLRKLFQDNPDRFKEFSFNDEDFLIDFSKNLINTQTKQLLLQLASACKLSDAIPAMFNGEAINETENRPVLHIALRNFSGKPI